MIYISPFFSSSQIFINDSKYNEISLDERNKLESRNQIHYIFDLNIFIEISMPFLFKFN